MMNDELFRRLTQLERRLQELERSKPEVGRWVDWTPTVTQSGSVTFTITFCRYIVQDNVVNIRGRLAITSAGTGNNNIVIGAGPAAIAPANAQNIMGGIRVTDTGTADYVGALLWNSSTQLVGQVHSTGATTFIGVNPNFALASGDIIGFFAVYERA
jgi:hypothetical protein